MSDPLANATPAPTVAIITVTYNAARFIQAFLDSVGDLLVALPDFRLVVVDNASADATVDLVKTFVTNRGLDERCRVVASPNNAGFGTGCNMGAAAAAEFNPDYYWFLNPDTTVEPAAGLALLALLRERPQVDFAGSALKDEVGNIRSGAFRFPGAITTFLSAARLGVFDRLLPEKTSTYPVRAQPFRADWLTGASFMVKRQVFDQLGGFDQGFFLYFEEVDLFYRAHRAGYNAWFCPQSVVFHSAGASTGINQRAQLQPKRRPAYWFESRRRYYHKNFGAWRFGLIDLSFVAGQSIYRLKNLLARRPSQDPPYLMRDVLGHSVVKTKATRKD